MLMKKLFIFAILFSLAWTPATIDQLQFKEVIELPGVKKEQIFNKTMQWIAENFKSAKTVIQYKDAKEGKIICQMITTANTTFLTYDFQTTMTIDIKDDKSRFTYLANEVTVSDTKRAIYGDKEIELAKKSYESVKSGYKDYILKQSKKSDDNW
jgi:hypothetical protein